MCERAQLVASFREMRDLMTTLELKMNAVGLVEPDRLTILRNAVEGLEFVAAHDDSEVSRAWVLTRARALCDEFVGDVQPAMAARFDALLGRSR